MVAIAVHAAKQDFSDFFRGNETGRNPIWLQPFEIFGAGEGNRTLVYSLGSYRSTIELRPH